MASPAEFLIRLGLGHLIVGTGDPLSAENTPSDIADQITAIPVLGPSDLRQSLSIEQIAAANPDIIVTTNPLHAGRDIPPKESCGGPRRRRSGGRGLSRDTECRSHRHRSDLSVHHAAGAGLRHSRSGDIHGRRHAQPAGHDHRADPTRAGPTVDGPRGTAGRGQAHPHVGRQFPAERRGDAGWWDQRVRGRRQPLLHRLRRGHRGAETRNSSSWSCGHHCRPATRSRRPCGRTRSSARRRPPAGAVSWP